MHSETIFSLVADAVNNTEGQQQQQCDTIVSALDGNLWRGFRIVRIIDLGSRPKCFCRAQIPGIPVAIPDLTGQVDLRLLDLVRDELLTTGVMRCFVREKSNL